MVNDLDIADLVIGLYEYSNGPKIQWDHRQKAWGNDGVEWALKRVEDVDVIVMRGSTTIRDFLRDFEWIANPITHKQLGPIHPGFLDGLEEAWVNMKAVLRQPLNYIICGHSLGAARACIITAYGVIEQRPPIRRVCFGEPRAGFDRLRLIVSPVPTNSYRNKGDLIARLPINIGVERYVDSVTPIDVAVPIHGKAFLWGPLGAHHMMLYKEAVEIRFALASQ